VIASASALIDCQVVQACIACGGTDLHAVLDLGPQPLANNLVTETSEAEFDASFPLGIQLCESCGLVQLTHTVRPERMFSSYRYVPSTSSTWLEHCDELADSVSVAAGLGGGDLVVEVGSNDGALLRAFQRRGLRVLGVDPAANIAAEASANGVPTVNYFFGEDVAKRLAASYGRARLIVSTNVLAHVPDPVDLLRGVRALLAPDGLYVNESPSLAELVANNEFDTIYHEHVSYLSLHALTGLFDRAGLRLVDAIPQSTHGGSLRVFGAPAEHQRAGSDRLQQLLVAERETGISDRSSLGAFAQRVEITRERLRALVHQLHDQGRRVAAYGATAKGNTLLGYCGLTRHDIEYIVDRNPMKQGMLTPGLRIPIVSPEHLQADPPDVLLLLAWNLADEIRKQLEWFERQGGQFLLPVPAARLL
jgi:novobiocin biosynthesis protein NovU/D-mycarose 3-C-methyltransferase